jgi:short subunit dehydrogenase-like uncharacterized protein
MITNLLVYGSYGYTGTLVTELLIKQGLRPIIGGRSREKLESQAKRLDLDYRVFSLENTKGTDTALHEASLVLHCAGPFSRTSKMMVDSCLRTGTHYLDVTGEVAVFESIAARNEEAQEKGVMLLPGVGFDVVPSDCLSAHLKQRLPEAIELTLAIYGLGRLSHGTATTIVENLDKGGLVRRDGKLVRVPSAWKTRSVDFGRGPRTATTIPWGDLSTAFHSTRIPNIEVYAVIPGLVRLMMIAGRPFGWLLGSSPVQRFLKNRIKRLPAGPTPSERARGKSFVWGEVRDSSDRIKSSLLSCPEAYTLTAMSAVAIARKVLEGNFKSGFQTPSSAYGSTLIQEIEGVRLEDL